MSMRLIQQIDPNEVAAVATLAIMPKHMDRFPPFVGATIPARYSTDVEINALNRLHEVYSGKLTIFCTIKGRRLLITLTCEDPFDLDDVQNDAETLQAAILSILGVSTCLVCGGYEPLCRCFDRAVDAMSLPGSVAGGGVTMH